MRRILTVFGATGMGLVLAGGMAVGDAAGVEPVELSMASMEDIVAGAYEPNWRPVDRGSFQRFTNITTSISMPIANAYAVCFMCSGDASAVAIANAIGSARADASSLASGRGQAYSRSDAVGPAFLFVMPDFARTPPPAARP